ncbi:MAG: hypothetical protein HYT03_01435 [Candidatus Harrisonbacteria bacterium]|nr:hypothetical protein [Candidatus Harrisonbacteria bacterium]
MQIIPAINAPDFETAEEQIKTAAEFFSDLPSGALAKEGWIHIDVTDGIFSPAQIWGNPEELKKLEIENLKLEIHLMVSNPEGVIDSWLRTKMVKRVIIHLEAMTDSVYILEKCRKYGAEAMLAINPGTEAERLLAHKDDFKYFQLLGVKPGWAGQKFNEKILDKIRFIKRNIPNAIIEIDGGVNGDNAKDLKEAGADILVSASYIFKNKDPKKAYETLKNA